MRVAALYDVHGNLPALEAVLAEAEREADVFVVGGDVTGGAFPVETVERLQALGDRALWLRGNLERELVETTEEREGGPPLETLERLRADLSPDRVEFLYSLPPTQRLEIDGVGSVLFCHATPWNDLDIVTPLTPDDRVASILEGVDADLVVAGHTHMQDRRARWLNAGSIGMPYEDEDGAYWALLGPRVELRRTPYDRAALAEHEYPQASRQEAAEYFETLVHE
jgi:predicted phosphodiesterase